MRPSAFFWNCPSPKVSIFSVLVPPLSWLLASLSEEPEVEEEEEETLPERLYLCISI